MKFIPNQQSWIGFTTTLTGTVASPKMADITACTDITKLISSLTANTQGQQVPTPTFDTLFESSIIGTTQASFSMDCYRDTVAGNDLAWTTLPRNTNGYIIIARFGGKPTAAGAKVEVWPITVTSRSMAAMTSNQVATFTVSAAVPTDPNEDAVTQA